MTATRLEVVVGQWFGNWRVVETGLRLPSTPSELQKGRAGQRAARCACRCTAVALVAVSRLVGGTTRSCVRCRNRRRYYATTVAVEVGQEFGRLRVVEIGLRLPPTSTQVAKGRNGRRAVLCLCSCSAANSVLVDLLQLVKGGVRSCGCLRRETAQKMNVSHGLTSDPELKVLCNLQYGIVHRCDDPMHVSYRNYGGRGISLYPAWRDVEVFVRWVKENLGPRPEGYTFDRIDNDGNYEPGNVRWASRSVQAKNQRRKRGLSAQEWELIDSYRRGEFVS